MTQEKDSRLSPRAGLTGTDSDFDRPTREKGLGRDAHGRPMLTIPRGLMVNEAPRRSPQQPDRDTGEGEGSTRQDAEGAADRSLPRGASRCLSAK